MLIFLITKIYHRWIYNEQLFPNKKNCCVELENINIVLCRGNVVHLYSFIIEKDALN